MSLRAVADYFQLDCIGQQSERLDQSRGETERNDRTDIQDAQAADGRRLARRSYFGSARAIPDAERRPTVRDGVDEMLRSSFVRQYPSGSTSSQPTAGPQHEPADHTSAADLRRIVL